MTNATYLDLHLLPGTRFAVTSSEVISNVIEVDANVGVVAANVKDNKKTWRPTPAETSNRLLFVEGVVDKAGVWGAPFGICTRTPGSICLGPGPLPGTRTATCTPPTGNGSPCPEGGSIDECEYECNPVRHFICFPIHRPPPMHSDVHL